MRETSLYQPQPGDVFQVKQNSLAYETAGVLRFPAWIGRTLGRTKPVAMPTAPPTMFALRTWASCWPPVAPVSV